MADNITLNSGAGGVDIAADDISGVHHQRVKPQHGADGSATDTSKESPMPVWDAFRTQVALGAISGYAHWRANGSFEIAGGGSAWQIIRPANNSALNFPTAAQVHTLVSTSTDDTTSGGDGARTVLVTGLNSSYEVQTESVILNGTTDVDTVNSYIRINRLEVASAGDDGVNAGVISCTAKTDTTESQSIAAGEGVSRTTVYTVPEDKRGVLLAWRTIHGANSGGNSVVLSARLLTQQYGKNYRVQDKITEFVEGIIEREYTTPILLPARCDVWIEGYNHDGANACVLNSGFELLLIDD